MKNFILKHKAIISVVLLILTYTAYAHYTVVAENKAFLAENKALKTELTSPSAIEVVGNELKDLRNDWYEKENKLKYLRKELLKTEKEKLDLEQPIRDKQSELDQLTGKK